MPAFSSHAYAPLSDKPSLLPTTREQGDYPPGSEYDNQSPIDDESSDSFEAGRFNYRAPLRGLLSTPKRLLWLSLPAAAALILYLLSGRLFSTDVTAASTLTQSYSDLLATSNSSDRHTLELYAPGWVAFVPSTPLPITEIEAGISEQVLSPACLDEWVSNGTLCAVGQGKLAGTDRMDLVVTWTNGTEAVLAEWRDALGPQLDRKTSRHFRSVLLLTDCSPRADTGLTFRILQGARRAALLYPLGARRVRLRLVQRGQGPHRRLSPGPGTTSLSCRGEQPV